MYKEALMVVLIVLRVHLIVLKCLDILMNSVIQMIMMEIIAV